MPEKYQIFDLYLHKEWSAEKVAQRFQINVSQVYVVKYRITQAIKAETDRLEAKMK